MHLLNKHCKPILFLYILFKAIDFGMWWFVAFPWISTSSVTMMFIRSHHLLWMSLLLKTAEWYSQFGLGYSFWVGKLTFHHQLVAVLFEKKSIGITMSVSSDCTRLERCRNSSALSPLPQAITTFTCHLRWPTIVYLMSSKPYHMKWQELSIGIEKIETTFQ